MLENGQRLENVIGQPALKISDFEEYGTKTGDSNPLSENAPEAKLLSTRDLAQGAHTRQPQRAGLARRAGAGVHQLRRAGRGPGQREPARRAQRQHDFVLLTFVVYNNLVNLGQSWIFVGLISFSNFLLALHGGVLLLGLAWLSKRQFNWVLRPARPLRRAPMAVRNTDSELP